MASLSKALLIMTACELGAWLVLFLVWHFARGFVPAFIVGLVQGIREADQPKRNP